MRELLVHDPVQGVQLPVAALYPTASGECLEHFGPYTVSCAYDAAVLGGHLPVVVISHGRGGSPWTHRETARHLARAGMLVVLVEHIGNSRSDGSLTGTVAMLAHRPRHVRLALDAVLAHDALGPSADTSRIAIVGHSIGAYTALAVAGGQPSTTQFDEPVGPSRAVLVEHDDRVGALVLLAPAVGWFQDAQSLASVRAPILMLTGALDTAAPSFHAGFIVRALGPEAQLTHVEVPNAGHHAFQTPFPEAMTSESFPPSQDPPGFDRVTYHAAMNAQIAGFLAEVWGGRGLRLSVGKP